MEGLEGRLWDACTLFGRPARPRASRGLVEVVLVVEDIRRSLEFYRDVLGLELISPSALPVKFLRVGAAREGLPQQLVLIPRAMAADQPLARSKRLHHIGLEVATEDYEAERERLAALGFALRGGQHPFMPVEAFYLDDPDGNEIEIATWRGSAPPQLRNAFLDLIENDARGEDACNLAEQLSGCTDVLPFEHCEILGLASGSTFAQAAHAVRATLGCDS